VAISEKRGQPPSYDTRRSGAAPVSRRKALRTLAAVAAGAVASPLWVESLSALARQQAHAHAAQAAIATDNWKPKVLNARQNDSVIVLTELIIPQTDTPGAKAARVNRFVDTVLQDAKPADRATFVRGLTWIDQRSQALFKKAFAAATAEEQTSLLTRLSAEGNPDNEATLGRDFFRAIKSMTINGYYTSQIGLRQELGDDGQLFLAKFTGCTHPEHQP
jgi:Gluconate 2-dehydrogenase subunit 3